MSSSRSESGSASRLSRGSAQAKQRTLIEVGLIVRIFYTMVRRVDDDEARTERIVLEELDRIRFGRDEDKGRLDCRIAVELLMKLPCRFEVHCDVATVFEISCIFKSYRKRDAPAQDGRGGALVAQFVATAVVDALRDR